MSHTALDSKQKRSRGINHIENDTNQTACHFPLKTQNNSLAVRSACRTYCLLNDHEKDAETSKDLVLDEEELQNEK